MKRLLQTEGDLLIGNDYWQYKVTVEIRGSEVWDSEIEWAKGAGPDDESLELTEFIEDTIKWKAEVWANEQIKDILTTV